MLSSSLESSLEESSSALSEPPDPDVVEVDPTSRYIRFKDVLGKGATKIVYKAFDELDGIEVAWNQIHIDEVLRSPQDLERLYSEVHLLRSLKHKNIIKFYNSWIDDKKKTINIITELFTSGSLRQYRKKHKKVDIKAVKSWARQILTGLDYLHRHNPPIIHRDLKCDNIFINGNHGEVKIGDLGLAAIMQQTNAHSVLGTPEFMAPELYDEEYNELVDIYSFGMCMLEMVTFELPYCECKNSAQIFKKVSSGIKPASLSKVKDPDVKFFIEKCLLPASQRVSASELLKDPFLQVDVLSRNSSFQNPSIVSPKVGSFGNSSVLSEEPNHNTRHVSSMDVDAKDIDEPPVVVFVEKYVGDSLRPCLEIEMSKKSNNFKLKGEMTDDSTVSLVIRLAGHDGRARNVHFLVDLGSDTSLSIAGEMVENLELAEENVMFIAELIDLSLINLIPNWTPSVPIPHVAAPNGNQTSESHINESQKPEERDVSSVVSFYNLFETFHVSNGSPSTDSCLVEESLQPTQQSPDYVKLDEIMSHVDSDSRNTITEDQRSNMSFVSAHSVEGNSHKKFSISTCMSEMGFFEDNGCGMKTKAGEVFSGSEIGAFFTDKDMGIDIGGSDMPIHLNSPSNASSVFAEDNDDEELRMELEQIELQYQEAMKEISMKRHEAIMAAKNRLSKRKVV